MAVHELEKLRDDVRALSGPDTELDYRLSTHFDGPLARHSSLHLPYTSSIDAALALCERVLPDLFWAVGCLPDGASEEDHHEFGCNLHEFMHVASRRDALGHGATPPLAIIDALLTALIANPEGR